MNKRRSAFTLVEILVVLAIIAILAAILFPAFNRAKESARQTNCQSNLQQIYAAVQLYKQDEGRYPATLLDILAEGAKYNDGTTTPATLGNNAPGYFKAGQDSLTCQNDDTLSDVPRSSYGFLSKTAQPTPLPTGQINSTNFTGDLSQFVWNYWGTREDGFTYANPTEAATATTPVPARVLLVNPALPYNQQLATGFNANATENLIKFSMSNRFAPPATIITHCIHHRFQTGKNVTTPGELYGPTPIDSANTRDIVLRLDGSAKAVDVTQWKTATPPTNFWQTQTN